MSKNPFFQRFLSLTTKFCCFFYSITSFFELGFIALIFNWEHFITAECSVLSTWGLWTPRRIFLFFGACLSKTYTKLLSKVQFSYELHELGSLRFRFSSDWKSVYVTFLKSRWMSIFGFYFWSVILSIKYVRWWWSPKPVSKVVRNLNEYLWFVTIKSIQEPSPTN